MDARLRVFTADGTNEPRVVRLFPPESRSCPARTSCYHITAARLAVGLSDSGTWRPLNLTRRNKRRRADKTSGRKRPWAGNVDIVPAGDVAKSRIINWLQCDTCRQWLAAQRLRGRWTHHTPGLFLGFKKKPKKPEFRFLGFLKNKKLMSDLSF